MGEGLHLQQQLKTHYIIIMVTVSFADLEEPLSSEADPPHSGANHPPGNEAEPSRREFLEEQQEQYGGSEYGIDWEEVKEGKSAGMPGKWVSLCVCVWGGQEL